LRLLHLADVHIGHEFKSLGEAGREQREQLLATFERVCRLGVEREVDATLIAGDLFDRQVVGAASLARVACALELLTAARIPVVILPGTHDPDVEGGVWRTWSPQAGVTVLTEAAPLALLEDLDLAVHGAIGAGAKLGKRLAGWADEERLGLNVGMVHGSLPMPGLTDSSPEQPLDPSAIEASGMDYVALGHWHGMAEHRFGGVTAAYPGSPEPVAFDQRGAGNVLIVELGGKRPVVEPVRVGRRTLERLFLDVGQLTSEEAIARAIGERAGPNVGLEVTLGGVRPASLIVDADGLENELSPGFFRLSVVDDSHPALERIDPADYPEGTVVGRFVRLMEAEAQDAAAVRDEVADALALGVALLQGDKVPL
jgi:DNA repair protein SbcD/Mre11